ncbi:MAG: hypothetical protein ACXQS5_05820 [Candidatus Methanospirareceae archaeon]
MRTRIFKDNILIIEIVAVIVFGIPVKLQKLFLELVYVMELEWMLTLQLAMESSLVSK